MRQLQVQEMEQVGGAGFFDFITRPIEAIENRAERYIRIVTGQETDVQISLSTLGVKVTARTVVARPSGAGLTGVAVNRGVQRPR